VATLKATGEYDDTVIMFTSDNGYFLGEHRVRQGKLKPHEPSLRVPFVVAGPGVPHGRRYDPVTTEDVTATILDLAGARPPHPADGASLVPSFAHDRGWRVPVLTEGRDDARVFALPPAQRTAGFDDVRTTIGIRTARWKYVRYDDGDGELYDLDRDPNELRSRYGDPAYARVQARLQQVWLHYKDCDGAACRAPMPQALQRSPTQTRTGTVLQERGVQRYGYLR
jgi:N-acetylglucosamine-6-sulfatase